MSENKCPRTGRNGAREADDLQGDAAANNIQQREYFRLSRRLCKATADPRDRLSLSNAEGV
jgi:hypothetical protein